MFIAGYYFTCLLNVYSSQLPLSPESTLYLVKLLISGLCKYDSTNKISHHYAFLRISTVNSNEQLVSSLVFTAASDRRTLLRTLGAQVITADGIVLQSQVFPRQSADRSEDVEA